MKTVYSPDHRLQHGAAELFGNQLVPVYEKPARAEAVIARIREVALGPVVAPEDFGRAPLERVHEPAYVTFLQNAWDEWTAAGGQGDALCCFAHKPDMGNGEPKSIFARLGYYSSDGGAPIMAGTWRAAYASAQTALTAAAGITAGERAAFALCRPPGHHASRGYAGGYCFLNNAAIAAQALIDGGAARVALLDVDYHHGNGSQCIFYDRPDVLFLSLHGDPAVDYPFYLGFADERGAGAGEGYNANYPLPRGTAGSTWFEALDLALQRIREYGPEVLVVSLGVDTYEGEPTSFFRLRAEDYLRLGASLARLGLPTLFIMEGGYNIEAIGINTVNVLSAFEDR